MADRMLTLGDVWNPLDSALKVQQMDEARTRSRLQAMQQAEYQKSEQAKNDILNMWQPLDTKGTPAKPAPQGQWMGQGVSRNGVPGQPLMGPTPATPPPSAEAQQRYGNKQKIFEYAVRSGNDPLLQQVLQDPELAPMFEKSGLSNLRTTGMGFLGGVLNPQAAKEFVQKNPQYASYYQEGKPLEVEMKNGVPTKIKAVKEESLNAEQLAHDALKEKLGREPTKAEISKKIQDDKVAVAGATSTAISESKEKIALNAIKQTLEDPVAGAMMMSGALAQGLSPEKFANLTQSTRGIQGAEAKGYLMRAYSNYVQKALALPPAKVGAFLSARQNAYTANLGTQRKAQEFALLNNRAIEQATTMGSILQKESGALTQAGSRPRAAVTAWTKNAINDPEYGRFIVALNSYLSEYMKVVSGGALSVQQITDSARTKGQELLTSSDNFETLNGKLDIMKQEMKGTTDSWNDAVNTAYGAGAMTDITRPPASSAPTGPALSPGTIENGYKFKGGDPGKQENWEKM